MSDTFPGVPPRRRRARRRAVPPLFATDTKGARLPGVLAQHPGDCPRCPTPIRAQLDTIVFVHGRAIHTTCASGADDR